MEIEIEREELPAVHKWNSAQLVKRRNRAVTVKVFTEWRRHTSAVQEVHRQRELSVRTIDTQSSGPLSAYNEQLRRELEELQREQRDLERTTSQIREELRGLQNAAAARTSVVHSRY
jgi:vacuolar-type H+-ATPase subunit I/STV1